MGRYIPGPPKKLQTLKSHGAVAIPQPASFADVPAGKALIVLVDNDIFDAAVWVYDELEFDHVTDPADYRSHSFWLLDLVLTKRLTGTA